MTDKKRKSTLAKNIITRRNNLGWTAMELAEKAQVPYPTVRNIEADVSGGRKETLELIAAALNCTVDDLYQVEADRTAKITIEQTIEHLAEKITRLKEERRELEEIILRAQLEGFAFSKISKLPPDILEALRSVKPSKYEILRAVLGISNKEKPKKKTKN